MTAAQDPGDPAPAQTPRLYFQDIRVENGVGYGVIGADMHVFGDRIPLYLLENWHDSPAEDPQWLRELPSRLLNARHGVVDFIGREEELAALHAWRQDGPRLAVRWLHAPGGTGKTRLAARFAADSAALGWKVVTATHGPGSILPEPAPQDLRPDGSEGVLLIVDYADRWPRTHLMLLLSNRLLRHSDVRTRVLLVARTADDWPGMRGELDRLRAGTSSHLLAPLPQDLGQRTEMFTAARDGFARHYGIEDARGIGPPAALEHPDFALTLAVHISALVAVDALVNGLPAPADMSALTVYLIDREHAHWRHLAGDGTHELNPAERTFRTPPPVMNRLVYTASLTGALVEPVGEAVVGSLRLTTGRDAAGTLTDHAVCYPPAESGRALVLEPLYPDRLAEDFLALTVPGHPADYPAQPWAAATADLLLERRDQGPALWTPRALTFLLAAAERWRHLGPEYLWPLLRTDPQLALDAGAGALGALARLADAPIEVLEAVETRLPEHVHPDLDPGIAVLARRLALHRLAGTHDPRKRIDLRLRLAKRLANAGLWDEALDHSLQAAVLGQELAAADPPANEGLYAAILSDLSLYLGENGLHEEALSAATESADTWRRLARAEPEAAMPNLSAALGNLGAELAKAARPAEGLVVSQEALAIRRRLAQQDPGFWDRWVADALHNVASGLAEAGRWAQSMRHAEESLAIYRRLAEESAERFEPDVAAGLANLIARLLRVGRYADALATAEEAVAVYQRLTTVNKPAYEHRLAGAVGELADVLSDLGRHQDALAAAQRAAAILRRLAAADAATREPDLARALHSVALYESRLSRSDDALATAAECLAIWRRLAAGDPGRYSARLAHALSGMAAQSAEVGDIRGALDASAESVALLRELVTHDPARHTDILAMTLANQGGYLAALGRADLGLQAAVESVALYRNLSERNLADGESADERRADEHPAPYDEELAMALGKLGNRYTQVRDPHGAAAAYQEAVTILRRLALANPEGFEPALAYSLRNLSPALDRLRRHEEATLIEQEAVAVLRRLAAGDRARFEPMLAGALSDLAASLTTSGRARQGTPLAEEAVAILVPAAAQDPDEHAEALAVARRVLALARAKGLWSGLRGR